MQEFTTFISNHPMLSLATAIILALLIIVELLRARGGSGQLSPLQVTRLINHDNAVVIDVRPSELYRKNHIIDAQSISINEIQSHAKKLEKFKGRPIIVVCSVGNESQKIAASLLKQGLIAYSLAGGMRAWNQAEMPL